MRTGALTTSWLFAALTLAILSVQPARAETVKVYAAAVVKDPLSAIAAGYETATGNKVTLVFDTAGATEQRFRADPQAALLITTVPLIRNAEASGALRDGRSTLLGGTVAAVAVTPGTPKPDVSTSDKLKAALIAARRIAVSDPARGATVGTHFMKVIEALGVKDEVLRKVTFAPDGLATMRLVVQGAADLGVSQSSEIEQASPDAMAGPFPKEYALSTDFALWHHNNLLPAAAALVERLTGREGREKLVADGIIPPSSR
jgi:molybdate transport system substrate-binding protein